MWIIIKQLLLMEIPGLSRDAGRSCDDDDVR